MGMKYVDWGSGSAGVDQVDDIHMNAAKCLLNVQLPLSHYEANGYVIPISGGVVGRRQYNHASS